MVASPLEELSRRVAEAAPQVAAASTETKDAALTLAADLLEERTIQIVAANEVDVSGAQEVDTPAAVVDRLRLTPARVAAMASGLRQVAGLADPIGETVRGWVRP